MTIVVYVMSLSKDYKPTANALKYIFELIPQFTITYGFLRYSGHVITNNECKFQKSLCNTAQSRLFNRCCAPGCIDGSDCPESQKPYIAFASDDNPDAIGCELLYLALDIFLYFTLVFLFEYGIMSALFEIIKKVVNNLISEYFPRRDEGNQLLDDDVMKEQDRVDGRVKVSTHQQYEDIMLVHNLTKDYTRTFRAVKGISFGVAPGECFGLLGVNGAGKTTTFQMLTGDEIPTDGEAWINKLSLRNDKFKFLAQIGYCPQFDALNESLTGYEMLKLFANLRGVPKTNIEHEVNKWISLLGLREYQHRQCGTYSGGNKRKLSTAMALIGDPPIVFLDEPTSGVDPVARRNLWTVLTTIQKSGQSVVLTSHSMEECEALCNRLAIMVKGQFMCMGGIQYLKQKFGQGFTIMIKLRVTGSEEQIVNRLKEEIERNFICNLKDEHQGLLHYHVTDPNTPWKQLFTTMELMKLEYSIVEDYTISETTLEQVFLSFAKVQPEEAAGLTQVIHA
ncbi:hypothetical protein C0J52_09298 [Blattella germanica]|nr:hypothetical protein C0J52_09298 [Blattella germanica]